MVGRIWTPIFRIVLLSYATSGQFSNFEKLLKEELDAITGDFPVWFSYDVSDWTRPLIGRASYPIRIILKTLQAIFHRRCLHIVFMNSAAIRELKLNDKNVEFPDNMKIVRRPDGTGKFENEFFADPISLKSRGRNR